MANKDERPEECIADQVMRHIRAMDTDTDQDALIIMSKIQGDEFSGLLRLIIEVLNDKCEREGRSAGVDCDRFGDVVSAFATVLVARLVDGGLVGKAKDFKGHPYDHLKHIYQVLGLGGDPWSLAGNLARRWKSNSRRKVGNKEAVKWRFNERPSAKDARDVKHVPAPASDAATVLPSLVEMSDEDKNVARQFVKTVMKTGGIKLTPREREAFRDQAHNILDDDKRVVKTALLKDANKKVCRWLLNNRNEAAPNAKQQLIEMALLADFARDAQLGDE